MLELVAWAHDKTFNFFFKINSRQHGRLLSTKAISGRRDMYRISQNVGTKSHETKIALPSVKTRIALPIVKCQSLSTSLVDYGGLGICITYINH